MLLRAFDNTPRFSYSFFSILVFMYFFSLMLGAVLSFSFLHCRHCNRNWSWSTFFSSREVQRDLDSFHRFSITVLSSIAASLEESRFQADNASVKSAKKIIKVRVVRSKNSLLSSSATIAFVFPFFFFSLPVTSVNYPPFLGLVHFVSPAPTRPKSKSRFVFILIRSRWP
jgi:hypothetical protein